MAAEYDFRRRPNPKGDGELQPLYPRIVNKGTIEMERLVQDIADMSSFTPGDVKGVVALLEDRISYYLSEGHHVQLGDIGYFSASLQARPVMDPKEIHSQTIFFGKVHLRVSPDFRKRCAGYVERAKYGFRKSAELSLHDYSGITGLLKNKALNDLNLLVEKGYLNTVGQGSHKVYVRADNKEVTE